jgi:hypothetical protein
MILLVYNHRSLGIIETYFNFTLKEMYFVDLFRAALYRF